MIYRKILICFNNLKQSEMNIFSFNYWLPTLFITQNNTCSTRQSFYKRSRTVVGKNITRTNHYDLERKGLLY